MNNNQLKIPLIPVGINYSHPTSANADVMVHFSKPIMLNDYKRQYVSNASAAILCMAKDSYSALKKKLLHIDDPGNYQLTDDCLTIKRNEYRFFTERWLQATDNRLEEEKRICDIINHLPQEDLSVLKQITQEYNTALKLHGMKDMAFSKAFKFAGFKKWLLVFGFPVFLLGYILNALPVLIAHRITEKKVSRRDFQSWVFVVSSSLLYLIWLLVLFSCFLIISWKCALGILVTAIATGTVTPSYINNWKKFQQNKRLERLTKRDAGLVNRLQQSRQAILSYL
jgi:hypothetical protein